MSVHVRTATENYVREAIALLEKSIAEHDNMIIDEVEELTNRIKILETALSEQESRMHSLFIVVAEIAKTLGLVDDSSEDTVSPG